MSLNGNGQTLPMGERENLMGVVTCECCGNVTNTIRFLDDKTSYETLATLSRDFVDVVEDADLCPEHGGDSLCLEYYSFDFDLEERLSILSEEGGLL